jgi:hypothetical protein
VFKNSSNVWDLVSLIDARSHAWSSDLPISPHVSLPDAGILGKNARLTAHGDAAELDDEAMACELESGEHVLLHHQGKPSGGDRIAHPLTEAVHREWLAVHGGEDRDELTIRCSERGEQVAMQRISSRRPVFCCITVILFSGVICDHAMGTTSERRCPVFKNSSNAKRCFVPSGHLLR